MLKAISRRAFLASGSAFAAAQVLANPPARSLRPVARGQGPYVAPPTSAADLVSKANLGGRVSFAVADASTGNMLEERASTIGLPPASVTKAVTALYALSALGGEYRFQTRLIGTGVLSNGVLSGDLILAGGGDPTLDTNRLAAMAAELKRMGVREVRGKFLVWGGALPSEREIDTSQPEQVSYNPAISGLNLNYNRVHFEWKKAGSGWNVTMDARSAKYRPEVRVARMTVQTRKVPIYTYADRGSHDAWTVASNALGKGGARWLPVRKPALYAGEVFQTFARSHGIVLPAPRETARLSQGRVFVSDRSAPLRTILRDMMKYSTNLTAETVGLTATIKRTGRAASLKASAGEMSRWANRTLGMKSSKFVDHSGLGDSSRMTASGMVTALVKARGTGIGPLMKPIPIRDAKGRPIKNHPIKVQAKTGTLNFVSCLAGYITGPDGSTMAFAILTGDTQRRASLSEAERERPPGARAWNGRAKRLQQGLIERWGALYAAS